jgi:hypothetical protein
MAGYTSGGVNYDTPGARDNFAEWLPGGLTRGELNELYEFLIKNKRVPTNDEMANFNNKIRNNWLGQRNTANKIANAFLEANAEKLTGDSHATVVNGKLQVSEGYKANNPGEDLLSPYYFDPSKTGEDGSKEKDIYDTFVQLAQQENKNAEIKASQDEANMQGELAGNRMKLLDELRNRRRQLLKNGLSSAQIANEEVQSLLIGQNSAQQIASNYFNQRRDIQGQAALIPGQSRLNAIGLFDQLNTQGSAYAAGGAGDVNYQAKLYDNYIKNGGDPATYDRVIND